ncbi:hypothetical protein MMC30_008254 [Trapelia coarctata]|nr:hypothetical protein [Trapelia coarctata]
MPRQYSIDGCIRCLLLTIIATISLLLTAISLILFLHDPDSVPNLEPNFPNHFATLDIPWGVSTEQVNHAMRRGALLCHPDKLPRGLSPEAYTRAVERYKNISAAAVFLRDEVKRADYMAKYFIEGRVWSKKFRRQDAYRELERTCRPSHRMQDPFFHGHADAVRVTGMVCVGAGLFLLLCRRAWKFVKARREPSPSTRSATTVPATTIPASAVPASTAPIPTIKRVTRAAKNRAQSAIERAEPSPQTESAPQPNHHNNLPPIANDITTLPIIPSYPPKPSTPHPHPSPLPNTPTLLLLLLLLLFIPYTIYTHSQLTEAQTFQSTQHDELQEQFWEFRKKNRVSELRAELFALKAQLDKLEAERRGGGGVWKMGR